jgi:hypothetical protein
MIYNGFKPVLRIQYYNMFANRRQLNAAWREVFVFVGPLTQQESR